MEPRIYTGSTPGNYFLRYSIGDIDYWDRNPADDVSDPIPITLIDNTGIDEFLSSSNITLYPNPASEYFNIDINIYRNELIVCDIYDITGKIIYNQEITSKSTRINIPDLSQGIYFVNLRNGESEKSHKILVK